MSLINHALYDWVAENDGYDLEIVRRPKRPRTGSSCRLMTSGLPIMATVQEAVRRVSLSNVQRVADGPTACQIRWRAAGRRGRFYHYSRSRFAAVTPLVTS